jgi:peptidase M28-like protein/PA domain-containing protein
MARRSMALIILLSATTLSAQGGRAPQIESISAAEMRADLFFLASDAMQGRLTDTRENAIAADWVQSRFERLGLKPGGQGGSFDHRYFLMKASLGEGNALNVGGRDAATPSHLKLGEHFYPHRFSANASVKAGVAFAGFGIVSPELKHDDYRDLVQNKIVLILDREPGVNDPASPFDGLVTAEAAQPLRKVLAAQEKGAVGVIFVEDVHNLTAPSNFQAQAANYWPATAPRIERYTLKTWSDRIRIPVVQVSRAAAELLVVPNRRPSPDLVELARLAETPGGITPRDLGTIVEMTSSVDHHTVPDRSIVATLDGSDPTLKNEYVLVSAHFDHDGADGPRILNGADDDGSGTVGLIEIAEAFARAAQAGQRPKRSIIFAAWNSEERGLLGAWAYTEDPVVPLDRIVAVLNMDMIGRNEEVPVGGGARFRGLDIQTAESNSNATNILGTVRSPELRAAFEQANKGLGVDLRFRYDNNASNLMRRSDHWPFIQRGVPGVWVHTGLHPDYHTLYDRPEKINYPKMEKIARLVYQTAWDLANGAARPRLKSPTPTTSQ